MPVRERIQQTPIKSSPLSLALGVNAVMICDCGCAHFKVGVAYNLDTGNNFIRVLECVECHRQMAATHQSDAGLAPSVGQIAG